MSLHRIFEAELKAALEWFDDNPVDSPHFDCAAFALRKVLEPDVADWVEVGRQLGATIEEVGEPGYYDHHGNDGAFVAPGRYLVYKLPVESPTPQEEQ